MNKQNNYTIFPNELWDLPLTDGERLLLIALYSFSDKTGKCYPSYTTLSKRSGLSRPTISKCLKKFITVGILTKETKFHNTYWLTSLTSKVSLLVNLLNQTSKASLPVLVNLVNSNYTNLTKPRTYHLEEKQVFPLEAKQLINKKKEKFIRPTKHDIEQYAKEIGFDLDIDYFIDHYNSNGWKVGGKTPMKDWKATVRNWKRRDKNNTITNTNTKRLEFK